MPTLTFKQYKYIYIRLNIKNDQVNFEKFNNAYLNNLTLSANNRRMNNKGYFFWKFIMYKCFKLK